MDNDVRHYNFWVYIERDEGNCDQWVAHCLKLDIVSWGSSPAEAKDMVFDAVEQSLLDDLNQGLDPLDRTPAPQEFQQRLLDLQQVGRQVNIRADDVATREQVSRFATMISFDLVRNDGIGSPVSRSEADSWPAMSAA